ncbi:MAG: four helix bundle protein [Prevotella sp.]|nr:four helix bundle protein [Prevotella sp.]
MLGPYKNLLVWQQAILFTTEIYKLTRTFPREEIYGLVSQIRRAAVSIPSNIAEGYGRSTNTDLVHFLYMALGSSNEVDTQLVIAMNIGYITREQYKAMDTINAEINAMLRALIKTRTGYGQT